MNKARLLHLAKHLRTSRGLGKFNFSTLFRRDPECGTMGCALGECAFAFPEDWQLHDRGMGLVIPCLRLFMGACESAQEFFDLEHYEVLHLFYEGNQQPVRFGGQPLSPHATAEEVADGIEAFVKHKETKL